jgi:hypothetical protein
MLSTAGVELFGLTRLAHESGALDKFAGTVIASTTFEIVGLPPVQIRRPVPLSVSVTRPASS